MRHNSSPTKEESEPSEPQSHGESDVSTPIPSARSVGTTSSPTTEVSRIPMPRLLSIWRSLTPTQRALYLPLLMAMKSPLYWLMNMTKTLDEQDAVNPYKPFPDYTYFRQIYAAWLVESVLFIEKSRTMMLSWLFAGLCLHFAMKRRATRIIFGGPDEERALQPLNYARILWASQAEPLKDAWPLDRPMEHQSYNTLELGNDSSLVALPGKDPDRIRKEHPTVVLFDQAAIIERFSESYGVALAARPLKIVAITSAKPGDFRTLTKKAKPVDWPYVSYVEE